MDSIKRINYYEEIKKDLLKDYTQVCFIVEKENRHVTNVLKHGITAKSYIILSLKLILSLLSH